MGTPLKTGSNACGLGLPAAAPRGALSLGCGSAHVLQLRLTPLQLLLVGDEGGLILADRRTSRDPR